MDWRYLAGLFDGEGSLCLSRCGSWRYKGVLRTPTYRCSLSISNCHRGVLDAVCAFVGVGVVLLHRRASGNRRDCYAYMATGQSTLPLLRRLLKHVIVKREQVLVAMQYIQRRQEQRTRPLTSEDFDLVRRMRALNARSPGRGLMLPIPEPRPRAARHSVGRA